MEKEMAFRKFLNDKLTALNIKIFAMESGIYDGQLTEVYDTREIYQEIEAEFKKHFPDPAPRFSIMVGRHPEGITLNSPELLLDDNDEPMEFYTIDEAKTFLRGKGLEEHHIQNLVFLEAKDGIPGQII